MVGIIGEVWRVVEHDQRKDHLLECNPIHGDAVLGKMRGRIDVGAVLADHFVEGRAEAILGNHVRLVGFRTQRRRHLGLAEARPYGRVYVPAMRQIDEGLAGDRAVGALEIALGTG